MNVDFVCVCVNGARAPRRVAGIEKEESGKKKLQKNKKMSKKLYILIYSTEWQTKRTESNELINRNISFI